MVFTLREFTGPNLADLQWLLLIDKIMGQQARLCDYQTFMLAILNIVTILCGTYNML